MDEKAFGISIKQVAWIFIVVACLDIPRILQWPSASQETLSRLTSWHSLFNFITGVVAGISLLKTYKWSRPYIISVLLFQIFYAAYYGFYRFVILETIPEKYLLMSFVSVLVPSIIGFICFFIFLNQSNIKAQLKN